MNKLLESAKYVLYLWDYNGNLFASNHADYTRMEALRQAVNEAERKHALTELTKLSQELGLYE